MSRRLLAVALAASLLPAGLPLRAHAQEAPGDQAVSLPPFLLQLSKLLDRIDEWKAAIPEDSPRAAELRAKIDELERGLRETGSVPELDPFERKIAELEGEIRAALHPEIKDQPEEKREDSVLAAEEQKRVLALIEKKRVLAGGRAGADFDALKKQVLSAGLDRQKLAEMFDRVRTFQPASLSPAGGGTPVVAAAPETRPSRTEDLGAPETYPAPKYTPAKGRLNVPEPNEVLIADEESVIRIARENRMNVGIVRQAFREARRQGVDYRMVLAVIKTESAFNPNATSRVGARGLMQIMPATGKGLGVKNPDDLYDPMTNIRAGIKFLKSLWNRFSEISYAQLNSVNPMVRDDVKKAIAAYNAGPGAVKKYGGVPPYRETRNYVVKVLERYVAFRGIFPA